MDFLGDENNVINVSDSFGRDPKCRPVCLPCQRPRSRKSAHDDRHPPLVSEEDIREQFRKAGYEKEANEIKITIVESESYAKEIAKATENIDLLVIGHHPKNAFLAALIDSVDERVADLVSCPVLVVPK